MVFQPYIIFSYGLYAPSPELRASSFLGLKGLGSPINIVLEILKYPFGRIYCPEAPLSRGVKSIDV
jgi:hypothetical protein